MAKLVGAQNFQRQAGEISSKTWHKSWHTSKILLFLFNFLIPKLSPGHQQIRAFGPVFRCAQPMCLLERGRAWCDMENTHLAKSARPPAINPAIVGQNPCSKKSRPTSATARRQPRGAWAYTYSACALALGARILHTMPTCPVQHLPCPTACRPYADPHRVRHRP